MYKIQNGAIALALAGALALGAAAPAAAAPVSSSTLGVKSAATTTDNITDVRWRGRRGWGPGAAVAAGILGLGIAAATAPRYYYDDPYYAPRAYYGGPYAYYGPRYYYGGPRYYGPRYYSGRRAYGPRAAKRRLERQRRSYNP